MLICIPTCLLYTFCHQSNVKLREAICLVFPPSGARSMRYSPDSCSVHTGEKRRLDINNNGGAGLDCVHSSPL